MLDDKTHELSFLLPKQKRKTCNSHSLLRDSERMRVPSPEKNKQKEEFGATS